MDQTTRILAAFLKNELESNDIPITAILLFGSQATGSPSPSSDLDLAIVSEKFEGKDSFERNQLIKRSALATLRKFLTPIEFIPLTSNELRTNSRLISGYVNQGISLV